MLAIMSLPIATRVMFQEFYGASKNAINIYGISPTRCDKISFFGKEKELELYLHVKVV